MRHFLFPRLTDIGRSTPPVECRWLSVPRRCVWLVRTITFLIRLRSGAGHGVATDGSSGETSSPGVTRLPTHTFPTLERTPLRSEDSFITFKVGTRPVWPGSFALHDGSCLLPLALLFHSQADDVAFTLPPALRKLSPRPGHHRFPDVFPDSRSFRDVADSFFSLRLRPRLDLMALICRSSPSDSHSPH
jgi:hypothetical protein